MKHQISRQTADGSLVPLEVFEGETSDLINRIQALQTSNNGKYISTPYIEPVVAPAEPTKAPSA